MIRFHPLNGKIHSGKTAISSWNNKKYLSRTYPNMANKEKHENWQPKLNQSKTQTLDQQHVRFCNSNIGNVHSKLERAFQQYDANTMARDSLEKIKIITTLGQLVIKIYGHLLNITTCMLDCHQTWKGQTYGAY